MNLPIEIKKKRIISDAAAETYELRRDEWTLQEIANRSETNVSELFRHFPNKIAMLHFWYEEKIHLYREMVSEIEDFESLPLSDRLTNFMLSISDMLSERPDFVKLTFRTHVFKNLSWHPFAKEASLLFREMIENDSRVSNYARIFLWDEVFDFLSKELMHFILFSLKDKSENQQKTAALAGKLSVFIEDLLYNKVIDTGFDLARFFWQEGIIKVDITVPVLGRIKSGTNKESTNE